MSDNEDQEREIINEIDCPACNCIVWIYADQVFSDPPTEVIECLVCGELIEIIDPQHMEWEKRTFPSNH